MNARLVDDMWALARGDLKEAGIPGHRGIFVRFAIRRRILRASRRPGTRQNRLQGARAASDRRQIGCLYLRQSITARNQKMWWHHRWTIGGTRCGGRFAAAGKIAAVSAAN